MTGLDLAVEIAAIAVLLRQLLVLTAVGRTARFLRQRQPCQARRQHEDGPTFFVVLPVLLESAIITDTVAHFEALAHGHTAQVIVVTTARETDQNPQSDVSTDTVALVEQLAEQGKVLHLHYPDRDGLKGDQLNHAARHCAATLLGDIPAERVFLVCYDADSRPPLDSSIGLSRRSRPRPRPAFSTSPPGSRCVPRRTLSDEAYGRGLAAA